MDGGQITQGMGATWREVDYPEDPGKLWQGCSPGGRLPVGPEVVRQWRGPGGSWSTQRPRREGARPQTHGRNLQRSRQVYKLFG